MKKRNDDTSSLSHTRWNCQYHIIFGPKYRRKVIYGKLRRDIGRYIRKLCGYKGVEIIEANACSDHIHILVKNTIDGSIIIHGILERKISIDDFRRTCKFEI